MNLLIITEAEPLSHSVYTYNSDITPIVGMILFQNILEKRQCYF